MKNPFEILGIAPEICKKLTDEDLFSVVKSSYRALQSIYHPDKGGSHKQAIEVNLAYEMLNYKSDPEGFVTYREKYIKRLAWASRKRAKDLEQQLEQQQKQSKKTAIKYYEYILNRLGCGDCGDSIESLRSVTIGLCDVALQKNLPPTPQFYGTNYKQIKVDRNGRCFVQEVGSSQFHERKFTKFLGTIPKEEIEILPHLQGYETSPHVPFNLRNEKKLLGGRKPVFKNIILQENFITYCLFHLVPLVKERSYLISINTRNKSLILDGVIIKITRNSTTVA